MSWFKDLRLMLLMMPRVMPAMLQRVHEMIPMPDYMAEQMPEMMPKVMDNLMPHMVGDVAPLVTQPMINYLRGRNGGTQVQSERATAQPNK